MEDSSSDSPPLSFEPPRPGGGLARLARLTLKELREILRDRRTIITLVLMPLLLYPLVSLGFKQVFLGSLPANAAPKYRIVVPSDRVGEWVAAYMDIRDQRGAYNAPDPPAEVEPGESPLPRVWFYVNRDLEGALRNFQAEAAIRYKGEGTIDFQPNGDLEADFEVLYLDHTVIGRQAAEFIERRLARSNAAFLRRRLGELRVSQRAVPVQAELIATANQERQASVSLVTLVPLILILMTITGAVYPAIDLTAGERERGTLEILVAAPVGRLGLLLAKYFSVLTVALLTAVVNLATMTVTILTGGMGPLLFGDSGLTVTIILQVLGLLVLFATFFSAVLLTLTSFARTFKEAQAYLIPLMVVSIAPGLLSLAPGLELTGPLSIAPLVNIVLLGRDLLEHRADPGMIVTVVVSTLLYALAAISIAARFFAAETVLYSNENGWSDLFRRPAEARDAPTPASAFFSLALLFPAFFLAGNLIARLQGWSIGARLVAISLATSLLFAGFPIVAAALSRVRWRPGFRLASAPWIAWPAAALLGLSLWTFAHEVIVLQQMLGLVTITSEHFDRALDLVRQWRELHPALIVFCMAVVPAVCEELFFRGYLFSALVHRGRPATAILASAALFGLFHVVTPGGIMFERLLTSTLLGVVLGWVCWRTGSVVPGMLLHACHNGFLVLVAYYEPWLRKQGWAVAEGSHLPAEWLITAAIMALIGTAFIALFCRETVDGRR